MKRYLETASAALERGAIVVSVVGLLVMLLAILLQVVARYILFEPLAWTEELARIAMIWAGLAGATVAYKRNSDPTLVDWRKFTSARALSVSRWMRVLAVAGFAGCILWASPAFLTLHTQRVTESLHAPSALVVAAVSLMALILLVHSLAKLICGDQTDLEDE